MKALVKFFSPVSVLSLLSRFFLSVLGFFSACFSVTVATLVVFGTLCWFMLYFLADESLCWFVVYVLADESHVLCCSAGVTCWHV